MNTIHAMTLLTNPATGKFYEASLMPDYGMPVEFLTLDGRSYKGTVGSLSSPTARSREPVFIAVGDRREVFLPTEVQAWHEVHK